MQRRKEGRRKGEVDVIKDCLLDFHKGWLVSVVSSLVATLISFPVHHWLLGEVGAMLSVLYKALIGQK